jgi:hypothetical protein
MVERQLRNRIMATGVEAVPLDSESCRDSTELDCNVAGSGTLWNKESNTQYLPNVKHQNISLVVQEGSHVPSQRGELFSIDLYPWGEE